MTEYLESETSSTENTAPAFRYNHTVDFYNASEVLIAEFSAIALTGAYGESAMQYARCCGQAIFSAIPAADELLPWAVALGSVEPGGFGKAVISGLAPAYFSGTGQYVSPGAAGLTAGENGGAKVLLPPLALNGKNTLPGLLLLGTTAPAAPAAEYRGIFKLMPLSAESVSIVNGSLTSSAYCGATDVPGATSIPAVTLLLDSTLEHKIFLAFFYDADAETYSASFVTEVPENAVFSQLIGIFKSGSAEQIYKNDNGRMIFGEDWYLS